MTMADKAHAYVTKSFLIDIITRDIGILDSILELVDNSLDQAVELYNIDVTRGLTEEYRYNQDKALPENISVNITISKDHFIVEDNCGGITKNDLENEVFVFGNPKGETDYTGLSAFGIGMKRAFFKLGKLVGIRTRTAQGEAAINWNIDDWMNLGDEEWGVPFEEVAQSKLNYSYQMPGTIIQVSNLNKAVQTRFIQPEFIRSLKNRLETSYALFIKSGIKIILNGEELSYSLPSFVTTEELDYTSKSIIVDDVSVKVILGITPLEDRVPRGWYIFCNGRMVLEADKSHLTGWGTHLAAFHPKWNHFLGLVSFSSTNVKSLPWSSTKWGVEQDSHVYTVALEEMRLQAQPILNLLDRWKTVGDEDDVVIPLRDLLKDGQEKSLFGAAKEEKTFAYKPKKEKPDIVRIAFARDRSLVEQVKEVIGNPKMKNPSVGEYVFDYYVEREVN